MDGERISLRLEAEDLVLLDEFIERHPEYSNRSHFARIAFRSFIENLEGGSQEVSVAPVAKDNVITVEIPRMAHDTIVSSVRAGIYNSAEEAVVECVREKYIDTKQTLEAIKKAKVEAFQSQVQM
ncbi:ribbon-helix-helix domain-containing protein [Methanomassiliicoccus luminyensis]|jgi:Arc/MetJ-type ribon-helix-helix transcriptional regulator|uniref:ribbon-helix-helix domain-containing protein n=1 Tax=Methanomassiliicoccus luminyensis TaxID=1080712 RepID=UPI000380813E|nr:ribbon-helix-helix domain-containing protein [Methanomassiliicoccus luminyensis]